jgi:hypothetical protein
MAPVCIKRLVLVAVLIALAGAPAAGHGQSARAGGVVDGIVTDSALRPLADVTVSIIGRSASVVTPPSGHFRVDGLETTRYSLLVRRVGYQPVVVPVEIEGGDTVRVAVELATAARALDSVVVRGTQSPARLQEFESRLLNHETTASFTRDDILKVNPVETWQMLSRVPALKFMPQGANGGLLAVSTRAMKIDGGTLQAAPCVMSVMIDGVIMAGDPPPASIGGGSGAGSGLGVAKTSLAPKQTDGAFDMTNLPPPDQIYGIEVFGGPATIPPQYNGAGNDKMCGLIVIWTR